MKIQVVRQILEWNEDKSAEIRALLKEKKVFFINLMGSPGAGKTTALKRLFTLMGDKVNIGVIEGDIAGKLDAETVQELGLPVVQLNTDGACHIEAMSIEAVLPYFDLDKLDVLIVENIGNLVCPAEFDLGEDFRLALLSVPEGDDKIEKYPLLFSRCHALGITKTDVKAAFDFDETRVAGSLRAINPHAPIFALSDKTGEGFAELAEHLLTVIGEKIG